MKAGYYPITLAEDGKSFVLSKKKNAVKTFIAGGKAIDEKVASANKALLKTQQASFVSQPPKSFLNKVSCFFRSLFN